MPSHGISCYEKTQSAKLAGICRVAIDNAYEKDMKKNAIQRVKLNAPPPPTSALPFVHNCCSFPGDRRL
jgi:hypothetical protein